MNSVFDRLLRGDLRLEGCYDGSPWRSVSDGAKDLIRQLLVKSPKERMSLENIFSHPWIVHNTAQHPQ